MFEGKLWKLFILNWILMIIVYEIVVLKKVRPITHGDPELHKKYPGFRRNDAHLFTNRLLHWLTCWMFPPRFLLTAIGMMGLGFTGWLYKVLKPKGQKHADIPGLVGAFLYYFKYLWGRLTIFAVA